MNSTNRGDTTEIYELEQKPQLEENGPVIEVQSRKGLKLSLAFFGWFLSSMILTGINKILFSGNDVHEYGATLLFIQNVLICLVLIPLMVADVIKVRFLTLYNVMVTFFPIACCAAGDILCTNMAYSYVSVSVVVVVKSCASSVTYVVATLASLNVFRWRKFLCILWICASVCVSVDNMPVDHLLGVVLGISAVLLCAFRWTMIQKFMQYPQTVIDRRVTPIEMLSILQPLMLLALSPIVLFHDLPPALNLKHTVGDKMDIGAHLLAAHETELGKGSLIYPTPRLFGYEKLLASIVGSQDMPEGRSLYEDPNLTTYTKGILLTLSAGLAMICILSEIYIVETTSSTTLCVGGVFKELVTLVGSHFVFGDRFTSRSCVAVGCSLIGILTYALLDVRERK